MRLLGAVAVLVGIGGLLLYPYHMNFHYRPPMRSEHWLPVSLSRILWFVWASAIAWGLATIARERIRSLTPPWAALATIFVAVPSAIETFRKPISDAVPPAEYIQNWVPPAGPLDLFIRTIEGSYFALLGSTLFLLLGVAWARNQRGWFLAGIAGLVVYAGIFDLVTPSTSLEVVFAPLRAAIPGAILFYAGYRLATRCDDIERTTRTGDGEGESLSD